MPAVIVIGLVAISPKLFSKQINAAIDAAAGGQNTEWYRVLEGSIYDGDTLRVERGDQELKIRFCGTDSPEIEQPGGIEARDHLRSLVAQGDGAIGVVPIEKDRYGRTVADLFVIRPDGSEIHLNSQMVMDGMAYHYKKYSGSCPQPDVLVRAEEIAKERLAGVWAIPNTQYPWNYRKKNR
ncbi:thermonuclease family protein [Leptolyngbya sp. Heron Island J]|uniref:thermonuclease family protein n=1 Tax=Leptolyngbya sp. Heron Island J TaxID=1385935 RepID=UPI0009DD8970|nr:thermonuclease family protein [Leptolyngbya sp. Heron Island J]